MVAIETRGRFLIATLSGELDHVQSERLRAQIDAGFEKSVCKHIIFDMKDVGFMDSSGIGVIIGRFKNAEKRGGQVVLAGMCDSLIRLFEVSGLAKIIARATDVKTAISMLEQSALARAFREETSPSREGGKAGER